MRRSGVTIKTIGHILRGTRLLHQDGSGVNLSLAKREQSQLDNNRGSTIKI